MEGDQTNWTKSDTTYFKETLPTVMLEQCVDKSINLAHLRQFIDDTFP
jgi:hypothetical protein